ncbi:MAG: serine/threonine-protein kinase [Sandaracinaceae bacterium]
MATDLAPTRTGGDTRDAAVLGMTIPDAQRNDVSLSATIVAPLSTIPIDPGSPAPTLRNTNNSVLPRVHASQGKVRLAPSEGLRYETVRTLGQGGMGEVALVNDRDIGRTVAVKKLLPEAEGQASIARFVDEVRTIGRLEHPNIVPIHDVGVDERGKLFFVMKYVEGETLEAILERLAAGDPETHRRYDVTRRVEIFMGVLRALQFAHEKGIVHRDIKPANVMVGRFGEVVLMDWGVARPIGGPVDGDPSITIADDEPTLAGRASSTHSGALIGTPLYMSPEQALGAPLDARSDLYSAAVMFHEMLNLEHRFAKVPSLPALLVAIQMTDPPAVTSMFPGPGGKLGVGPEYGHFLKKALARDPSQRWQSADEMIYELHQILEGVCRVQCMATFTKRMSREAGRFVDRNPRAAMFLLIAVSLVLLALVGNAFRDLIA